MNQKEQLPTPSERALARCTDLDLGGYYHFDDAKAFAVLRSSPTLNAAIDSFS